ncbi:MAG TPA: hypothetical protein VN969_26670 [Streptosporangiaceae bacterium]|nr:hypothetical protein [Streptosporangiaceae bacterium]
MTASLHRGQWKADLSGLLWCLACSEIRDDDGNAVQDGRLYRYFGGKTTPRADGSIPERVRRYRCQTCGKSVRADDADAEVDQLMGARGPLVPAGVRAWE